MIKEKGFTLIELLASITIMALVFGVIISSTNSIRKASRDAQRQADLRNIQSSLQQYYADQNFFPNTLTLTSSVAITSSTGNPGTLPSPVKTYMNSTPVDPLTTPAYGYYSMKSSSDPTLCSDTNCHYYSLCAVLEGNSPQSTTEYAKCTTKNSTGVTYTFQVNPS